MNIQPAERMLRLPTQFFSTLTEKVARYVKAGFDVINLGQGNPDLPTPPHIVESLRMAALDPVTHRYSPFHGLPALKEAACYWYKEHCGVELDPSHEVAILFGGKVGLVEISQILLNRGDVALVPDPGYPDYWSGVALAGGRMEMMPLREERGFLPDLAAIDPEISAKAKLMFINYPNNPTGAVATSEFFKEAVDFGRRNNCLIVHDYAYGAIGFDGKRPPSFLETEGAKDVGIEVYTLSKTYNMAGWRVGFAVGHRQVIRWMEEIHDHYYVSLFPAVQRAAITALTSSQDCVSQLVRTYESRRNVFVGTLREAGWDCPYALGSFFQWIPLPQGIDSVDFANGLLETKYVAVAPGKGFGEYGEGYIRIGLLAEEQRLREAAGRIGDYLASLLK